jgi:predicted ester cyclase
VTATHEGEWRGIAPTGQRLEFMVGILFPWDEVRQKYKGERVYVDFEQVLKRYSDSQ